MTKKNPLKGDIQNVTKSTELTEEQVTIYLIENIGLTARVVKSRPTSPAIKQAIQDLEINQDLMDMLDGVCASSPAPAASRYPVNHTNPKIPGAVIQYSEEVFIWHTLKDERTGRDPEMRVANSLKKAWAHLASHLRIKGKL